MARTKRYVRSPSVPQADLRRFVSDELAKIQASTDTLSAFVETLEDPTLAVEIGVWTPTLAGQTSAGVGTYTLQKGRYYKNGRLVLVTFRVTTTAHTGTGQAKVNNLPYVVSAGDGSGNDGYFGAVVTFNAAIISGLTVAGSPDIRMQGGTNIAAVMDILGSVIYLADS